MAETLRFTVIGHGDAEGIERLARSIDDLVDRIRRLDRANADPEIDIDTRRAERKIGQFARDLRRKIREAVSALPDIELNADSSDAQREIAEIRAELIALRDQNIGIDLDATEAEARMRELQARLARLSADSANIQVRADTAAAVAALGVVKQQADRLDGRTIQLHVSVARGFSATIGRLARLGNQLRGIAVATAAIGAIGAGPQIIGIGSAVLQLAGALALIPAGAVAATAGIATLVLGFQHLGDALGPADTPAHIKKVNRALAALTPSARELALTLRDLAFSGGFKQLQLDVQERLFRGVGQEVRNLSDRYLPPLRSMLGGVADGYNRAFVSSSQFLSQQPTVQKLSTAFDQVRQSLVNSSGAARPLTEAVVSLVSVGATRLPQLGQAVTNVATKFRDWVVQAERSGDLIRMIDRGISAIQQMGRIAINVGSSLGALFRAADTAGVDFLGTVERITSSIRLFLNSAQGQQTVVNLFRAIRETVDAAMPGVQAIGQALVNIISRLSNSGVLTGIAATFSSIAQAALPMVGTLTNLAAVVLPPLLAALRALAPVLVPVAVGLLAVSTAARGLSVLQGLGSRFTGFAGKISAASGGIGKFKVAMGGLAGFLGASGPWGLAIAAAVVGIGLLVGALNSGEQAAQEQKAALDQLKGTLDQYTGAVTQATVTQKAQELSTKKLADGSMTYLQAVKSLGISTADYTQASLGNADALRRVQTQLDTHVKGLIQAAPAYQQSQRELANLGLSLDDLSAAAQGNGPAIAKVNDAIGRIPSLEAQTSMRMLVDSMLGAGGASAELARALGISNGELAAAQQQVRDAAEASAGLAQQFVAVKSAFDAVPDQKSVTVQALTVEAQGLLTQLGLTVETLPDNKGVKVTAETAEAKANFDAFMAGVQNASADVTINGNVTPAQNAFQTILGAIEAGAGTVDINGNPMPASAALSFALGLINSSTATVTIDGQPTPVQTVLASVINAITTGQADVTIGGKTAPVNDALAAIVAAVQGANPTLTVVPDTAQADAARSAVSQPTSNPHAVGSPTTDDTQPTKSAAEAPTANPHTVGAPTTDNTAGARQAASAATANPHTVGDPVNTGPVDTAKATAQQETRSMHTIDVNDQAVRDAKSQAEQPTRSMHTIDCNDSAVRNAKAAAERPTSSTHTIHVVVVGGPPRGMGAFTTPRALGAYATPYASGGLRRMSAARAEIVPPRQPRVIGDRQVGDEAFIPINNSARSRSILQTTANRMGFQLTPNDGRAMSRALAGMPGSPTAAAFSGGAMGGDGGALLTEMRQLNATLHALRGDVDHHGDNASISARLDLANRLLARLGRNSAAAEAQGLRVTSELGSF